MNKNAYLILQGSASAAAAAGGGAGGNGGAGDAGAGDAGAGKVAIGENNTSSNCGRELSIEQRSGSESIQAEPSETSPEELSSVQAETRKNMMKLTNQQLFNKAMKERTERKNRIYKTFRRKQLVIRGCINAVSH